MKKVLTFGLAMLFATSMFAQSANINKNSKFGKIDSKNFELRKAQATTGFEVVAGENLSVSAVKNVAGDGEELETSMSYYDLQSNSITANRGYRMADGTMMFTATISEEESHANRGSAYNYYDGSKWNDRVDQRNVENFRTGWPTVVPYGEGAVLCNHSSGINVFTTSSRTNPEWVMNDDIVPGSSDYAWPKLATTTDGTTTYLHLIAANQDSDAGITLMKYWRSADGGITWEGPKDIPGFSINDGRKFITDNMQICTNGTGTLCILHVDTGDDISYARSEDNGETFEHHIIYQKVFDGEFFYFDQFVEGDSLQLWAPTAGSGVLDNNGLFHVVMNTALVMRTWDTEDGYYSIYRGGGLDGIHYWNENKGQIQTHPGFINNIGKGDMTCDSTFHMYCADESEYIEVVGALGGSWYGAFQEDAQEWPVFDDSYSTDRIYSYGICPGISIFPTITADSEGRIIVAYASITKEAYGFGDNSLYFRRAYAREYIPSLGGWQQESLALTNQFFHQATEVTFTYFPEGNNDGAYWNIFYQADPIVGLFLSTSDENAQSEASENIYKHLQFYKADKVGIEEQETVAHFQMSPNPAHNNVRISVEETSTIEIYNTVGQLVKVINGAQGDINVDVTSFANGIYLVNVRNANGKATAQKLIVQ